MTPNYWHGTTFKTHHIQNLKFNNNHLFCCFKAHHLQTATILQVGVWILWLSEPLLIQEHKTTSHWSLVVVVLRLTNVNKNEEKKLKNYTGHTMIDLVNKLTSEIVENLNSYNHIGQTTKCDTGHHLQFLQYFRSWWWCLTRQWWKVGWFKGLVGNVRERRSKASIV